MNKLIAMGNLLLMFFLLSNCTSDENQHQELKSASLGSSVFLQEKEGAQYVSSNEEIEVRISQINDSRCPHDVVCIWEGQVIVSFVLPTSETVDLCIGSASSNCVSSAEFIFSGNTYQLILIDIKPYPTTTNGAEKKVVEFTLVKVS